jgi:hypothetical protein
MDTHILFGRRNPLPSALVVDYKHREAFTARFTR